MAMLIKSLSWHTHPHPFPSQLAPRAGPQASLPAFAVAIPGGARQSILPAAGLLAAGSGSCSLVHPIAMGEWERQILGLCLDVPSMDRAMHPRQELVPTVSRLRAGTRNAISARRPPQEQ